MDRTREQLYPSPCSTGLAHRGSGESKGSLGGQVWMKLFQHVLSFDYTRYWQWNEINYTICSNSLAYAKDAAIIRCFGISICSSFFFLKMICSPLMSIDQPRCETCNEHNGRRGRKHKPTISANFRRSDRLLKKSNVAASLSGRLSYAASSQVAISFLERYLIREYCIVEGRTWWCPSNYPRRTCTLLSELPLLHSKPCYSSPPLAISPSSRDALWKSYRQWLEG